MKKIWYKLLVLSSVLVLQMSGCRKEFLDAKPSTDIVQPVSLDEFQKILDNTGIMNTTGGFGILSADEYVYSSDASWLAITTANQRNQYIWAKNLYEGEVSIQWNLSYSAVFYANNILAGLDKIKVTALNAKELNKLKGWALFVRGYAYYELVNNFSTPYDASTAEVDLGVPLRLKPSIDEIQPRSTVKETYSRIITDLALATNLLDAGIPVTRTRPSKVACHALFARIYLNMRDYLNAELHADACLQLYDKLIDYNTLNKTAASPFAYNHDEQIFAKQANNEQAYASNGANTYIQMSSDLIGLYGPNDLRLQIYFTKQTNGSYDPKRAYYGPVINPYVGLATDEIYLIKAECAARRGDFQIAMDKLNQLLIKRWNPNATVPPQPYQHISASSPKDALSKVQLERRKELVFRGLRWDDLKRLNKEGANITLTRTVNGQTYTLPPNDPRYTFPIPDDEINISGIQQNLR